MGLVPKPQLPALVAARIELFPKGMRPSLQKFTLARNESGGLQQRIFTLEYSGSEVELGCFDGSMTFQNLMSADAVLTSDFAA